MWLLSHSQRAFTYLSTSFAIKARLQTQTTRADQAVGSHKHSCKRRLAVSGWQNCELRLSTSTLTCDRAGQAFYGPRGDVCVTGVGGARWYEPAAARTVESSDRGSSCIVVMRPSGVDSRTGSRESRQAFVRSGRGPCGSVRSGEAVRGSHASPADSRAAACGPAEP